jgi:hypothetical protein
MIPRSWNRQRRIRPHRAEGEFEVLHALPDPDRAARSRRLRSPEPRDRELLGQARRRRSVPPVAPGRRVPFVSGYRESSLPVKMIILEVEQGESPTDTGCPALSEMSETVSETLSQTRRGRSPRPDPEEIGPPRFPQEIGGKAAAASPHH